MSLIRKALARSRNSGSPAFGTPDANKRITLPFYNEVTTTWDWADLTTSAPNDVPNLNLTVMNLILSSNIELTVGKHSWSMIENTLSALGFVNLVHHYFGLTEKINYPAMAFGRSAEPVDGKYVVAAVFRGARPLTT